MDSPKPGDRATKNGITCFVLEVTGGKVFCVRFHDGMLPNTEAAEFVYDRRPFVDRLFGDNLGEVSLALVDWQVAVVDAVYEKAG